MSLKIFSKVKLNKNVKLKVGLWKLIPFLAEKTAHGIYPNVYLPQSIYNNLKSNIPNPYNVALLLHEQEHVRRQKEQGTVNWLLKYIFSAKFRFNEELLADIPKIKYLKSKNLEFDLEKRAKQLSSWIYLWQVNYKEAKAKLQIYQIKNITNLAK